MKFTSAALLTAVLGSAQSALAASASVFTYNPQAPVSSRDTLESTSLSPATARQVLAQRAGVEDYHVSGTLDKEAISAINDFGVRTPLFGQDARIRKALILCEGVGETEIQNSAPARYSDHFTIEPSPSASRGLFLDLARQSDATLFSSVSDEVLTTTLQDSKVTTATGDKFIIASDLAQLYAIFHDLVGEATWDITAVVSSTSASSSDASQWGTYEMPNSQSTLRKRQITTKEKPLSMDTAHTSPFEKSEAQSTSSPISAFASNNSRSLHGILPACFTTQSACESATRNCTGHGRCTKKYTNQDASDGSSANCYSCQCSATVKNVDGKVSTTNWGGPACQKKDISVAFWLIALFSIGLMFLVGFAVGEIWGMGDQELPSVIGAGVSGPVKK